MQRTPAATTVEQLRRGSPWCCVVCERCLHRWAIASVPLIIGWGADTSSDMLRRSGSARICDRKGATLTAARLFKSTPAQV
jgi:hypothetical protein